jgi:hypothetical protein
MSSRCRCSASLIADGLAEGAVGGAEAGRRMRVDVELADEAPTGQDRHHDLRAHGQAAGEVVGFGGDVVDDHRLLALGHLSADAAAEGDARVLGGLANKGAEQELARTRRVDQVEAHPVVAGLPRGEQAADGGEGGVAVGGRGDRALDVGKQGVHGGSSSGGLRAAPSPRVPRG